MPQFAKIQDGIPTVATDAQRDALYPAPALNQRVYNTGTNSIERYTGSGWVVDFVGSGADVATITAAVLAALPAITPAATPSTLMERDSSGNVAAGIVTAALAGNADTATAATTATKLAAPQTINGVGFDGSAPVTVPAAAGTLTGATLAAGVTASSLKTFGPQMTVGSYSELVETPAIAAGSVALDLSTGTIFRLALNANTGLVITNCGAGLQSITLILDISGNFTVTWPASVHWAGGSAPAQSATNLKTDIITLLTTNGGTTWYGFVGGLAFVT